MTVTITVLLVIALVHLIAALIGFADGVVRLLTAMIGLAMCQLLVKSCRGFKSRVGGDVIFVALLLPSVDEF